MTPRVDVVQQLSKVLETDGGGVPFCSLQDDAQRILVYLANVATDSEKLGFTPAPSEVVEGFRQLVQTISDQAYARGWRASKQVLVDAANEPHDGEHLAVLEGSAG